MRMEINLDDFTIEHVKLKVGDHNFYFTLNKSFFEYFGYVDLNDCNFNTEVKLIKSDSMMIADIQSTGWMSFDCDRCLTPIKFPLNSFIKVIYYLNSEDSNQIDSDKLDLDLVYLRPSEFSINVSKYIYESFLTCIPMIRNCDDLNEKPCDFDILQRLTGQNTNEETNENQEIDPRWLQLKELLNKKED